MATVALGRAARQLSLDLKVEMDALVKAQATCFFGQACFAAGTPLRTPAGWSAIEELRVGDSVLSRDEHDPQGPVEAKVVEEVFRRLSRVWHLTVGGRLIRTSGEHPFYAWDKGWVACHELQAGDTLYCADGTWQPVEEVVDTGNWEPVYNLRVADWHTYFVGGDEWGFSVWAHNQYFYHATSDESAHTIIASGIKLSYANHRQDFGKAFYTTTDEKQARKWANRNFPGHGVVLKYNVSDSDLSALTVLSFTGVTSEWKVTVWAGRHGILDDHPLNADMVIGPFLTNPDAMKEGGASAVDAQGRGDQEGWLTNRAFTVLQRIKPVIV